MNKKIFPVVKINRWNISILVIFVLIASSLIWILTTNYIKDLMQYNNIIYGYYKSYYLSKAGLELQLSEIAQNWIWFENTIQTWDNIVSWNFLCKNCKFNSSILWNAKYFSKNIRKDSGCTNPIVLNTWESFILPLFKQINSWTNYKKLTTLPIYQNMANQAWEIKLEHTSPSNWELTIWIFIMSWEDILQDWVFVKTLTINYPNIINDFLNSFNTYATNILVWNYTLSNAYTNTAMGLKSFLLFGNTKENQQALSFCINIQQPWLLHAITLPTNTFYIKSIWNNLEKTIGLEAFLKQPIPEFLIHTYLGL